MNGSGNQTAEMQVNRSYTEVGFLYHRKASLELDFFIKIPTRCNLFCLFGSFFYNSTCFGRSPRPTSGVICLQTVVAATATTVCKQITPEDGRGLSPKHVEL